jgi:hypothetical protein
VQLELGVQNRPSWRSQPYVVFTSSNTFIIINKVLHVTNLGLRWPKLVQRAQVNPRMGAPTLLNQITVRFLPLYDLPQSSKTPRGFRSTTPARMWCELFPLYYCFVVDVILSTMLFMASRFSSFPSFFIGSRLFRCRFNRASNSSLNNF